jgi:RND family efflux transporter MFP subunit
MTSRRVVGFLCGVVLSGASVVADEPPTGSASLIVIGHCTIEYQHTALLGAPMPGLLQSCSVQLGEKVKAGQILGRLQDSDLRAELDLRAAEAESDVEIRSCTAKYNWQLSKLATSERLMRGHHLSAEEYNLQKLEVETAALTVEEAKHRRELAVLRRTQAEVGIQTREIKSPVDGVLVKVFKAEGESIQLNDPVFRVVNTSTLRVVGSLDVVDAWRVQAGNPVQITPEIGGTELPLENEEFLGRVVFIDSEIDPDAQTCRVIAEVDNRTGLLRAGLECRMTIRQSSVPAAPPEPTRPEADLPLPGIAPKLRAAKVDPATAMTNSKADIRVNLSSAASEPAESDD